MIHAKTAPTWFFTLNLKFKFYILNTVFVELVFT